MRIPEVISTRIKLLKFFLRESFPEEKMNILYGHLQKSDQIAELAHALVAFVEKKE